MGWGGYDYPSLLPSHVLGDRPWNGRRAGVRLGLGSSHLACVLPMDHFSGQTLALGADRLTIGQFRTPRVRKSRQHPVGTRGLWNPGNSLRKGGCLPPTPQSLLVSGPPLGLGSWVTTGDKQAWHSLLDKLLSPDLSCLSTVRLSAGLQTPALRAQLLPIAVAHLLHPFIPPPPPPGSFSSAACIIVFSILGKAGFPEPPPRTLVAYRLSHLITFVSGLPQSSQTCLTPGEVAEGRKQCFSGSTRGPNDRVGDKQNAFQFYSCGSVKT